MRHYPQDQDDHDQLARMGAQDWQTECLKYNPDYLAWGVFEDGMSNDTKSWDGRVILTNWKANSFRLDDLNEVVNFYFSIERNSEDCAACGGSGYNPETDKIAETFYSFEDRRLAWNDKITQDEADMLWGAGRLRGDFKEKPTAEQVNQWQRGRSLGHDGINRMMLIRQRAQRLGVYGHCETCGGHGYTFTNPDTRLALTLWVLHPRKGVSRGVHIERIERDELPEVFTYLRHAAERNANRFGRLPQPEPTP